MSRFKMMIKYKVKLDIQNWYIVQVLMPLYRYKIFTLNYKEAPHTKTFFIVDVNA